MPSAGTVRVLSRIGRPHDLIVVLDGTFEGMTTVASMPAGELDLAEVTAQSIWSRSWRPRSRGERRLRAIW